MVTSYPLPEGFSEIEVFGIGTALLVQALLGFILNGLTILSFYKIRELRTPSNLLIISLAVADTGLCINAFVAAFSSFLRIGAGIIKKIAGLQHLLLSSYLYSLHIEIAVYTATSIHVVRSLHIGIGVFQVLLSSLAMPAPILKQGAGTRYWPYGSEGCQIHGFQGFVAALSSISSCAAIAWDRYHQYCTRSKLHWSTSISVVLFAWGFASFWSMMPLFGWGEYDYEPLRTCCTLDYSKADRNYMSFLFPLAFFEYLIPLFIMMTAYQSIYQKLKKSGEVKVNTSTPVKSLIICWGPYSLLCFYAIVQDATVLSPKLRMMPAVLAKMSPAVNAYVYGLGNENYRGGIWQFLTGQKIEKAETDNKSK